MASRNSKADASLSPHVFFDDVVPEICIDTVSDVVYNHGDISGGVSSSPKSESKVFSSLSSFFVCFSSFPQTVVVRLSLTTVNANFVCQVHGFIEKVPARG